MERGPQIRQDAILGLLVDYINYNHFPPTVRELCDMSGIDSTSLVNRYLEGLQKDGSIEKEPGSRALRVTLDPSPIQFEER